jgi:hypothetical protein
MKANTQKQEIPLHLCQVLEEEFENLHEQPDAEGRLDKSVRKEAAAAAAKGGGPSDAPDWEFHEGHVELAALARKLQAAFEAWEASTPPAAAKGSEASGAVEVGGAGAAAEAVVITGEGAVEGEGEGEGAVVVAVERAATEDELRRVEDLATYLALRYPSLRGVGAGGLDTLNRILRDEDEGGKPNGADLRVFKRVRFEDKTLRDETRGLMELGWAYTDEAAFDDAGGARSDLTRFRRLLLEDAFPDEIRRVYDLRIDETVWRVHALEKKRSAVCFSGGGIRSGTFALGVVQSLAKRGLLQEFDYLSTVSGGGYVGAWLTAWIHRHQRGLEGVLRELNGTARSSKTEPEPEPLRHLRDFSNFITPRTGILSADSWTFIVIYIRNLLLNWVVLIPLLASVLMVPRVANAVVLADPAWRVLAGLVLLGGLSIFLLKPDWKTFGWMLGLGVPSLLVVWVAQSEGMPVGGAAGRAERAHYIMGTLLVAGALLSSYALAFMRLNRPSNKGVLRPGSYWDRQRDQNSFLWMCLLPLAVSTALLTIFWAWFRRAAGGAESPDALFAVKLFGVEFFNFRFGEFGSFMIYGAVLGVLGALIYGLLAAASWLRRPREMARRTEMWVRTPEKDWRGYRRQGWSLAGSIFKNGWRELIVTLLASMLGALLLYVAAVKIPTFYDPVVSAFKTYPDGSAASDVLRHTEWRVTEVYTYLAFPVYLLVYFLGLTLFVGFTSRRSEKPPRERRGQEGGGLLSGAWNWVLNKTHVEDEDREWLARASAWIFIVAGGWLLLAGLVMFGPLLYFDFGNWLAAAGGASGLVALLGGGSSRTPGGAKQEDKMGLLQTLGVNVLVLAAFVFFACIIILVSILTGTVIAWLAQFFDAGVSGLLGIPARNLPAFAERYPFQSRANVFHVLHFPSWLYLLALALALQLAGRLFAQLINLNKFSLHAGYRDRIIRAFLGASRPGDERAANPFTGFDPRDNLYMEEMRPWLLRESDFDEPDGLTRFVNALNQPPDARQGVAKFLRDEIEKMEGESRRYFKDAPGSVEINPSFRAALFGDLNRILQDKDIPTAAGAGGAASAVGRGPSGAARIRENRQKLRAAFDFINYPPKPYRLLHVVCMTLNLVHGKRLAWQQRRAQSFTASPLHSGTLFGGYRRTREYGGKNGISLGTAVAISGAAASSNMGYFSPSPFVTFVLTFFNARLGWWLGNPGVHGADTYFRSHPQSALSPIIDEAFGITDAEHPYVLLSDGGHFENLGLYEMVLRRCRNIVVVDGSADPEGGYSDLGSAVRKIRIDFGIPIVFPSPFPILARPESETKSGAYFAVGDIHYEAVDTPPDGMSSKSLTGKLIYIKPAIYNQEPRDIYNYAQGDKSFPHESTADQFFDEPQFESHRMLGYHILEGLLDEAASTTTGDGVTPFPGDLQSFVNWLGEKAEVEKRVAAEAEQEKTLSLFRAMLSSIPGAEGAAPTQNNGGSDTGSPHAGQTATKPEKT